MDENQLEEFTLEDIMKEFSDAPDEEELQALAQEGILLEPELEAAEEPAAATEEIPAEVQEETLAPEQPQPVTGDTIRMDTVQFSKGEVRVAEPVPEPVAEEAPEAFAEGWEPEYDDPIAEYVPPRPILVHPRSQLRELKRKLVAGPEKIYYAMTEKGLGKLQVAIFFSALVVLISIAATAMHAFGWVQDDRMRLMVFGQFLAMLLCALLGSFQLLEGVADLFKGKFSLNTLLVFTFLLCCVDGVLCLQQLRVPCCAAFGLQVTMSLWSTYQKRNTVMGQMDTMRKATHLQGLGIRQNYYEDTDGFLRGEAQVEDFMDSYQQPAKLEKVLSVYAIVALVSSVVAGIVIGVLHGVSLGIQVAAVATLAAMPATMFVTLSRPMAVLERRLHSLGAVLCGWESVDALNARAVFPVDHEDLCPIGTVKLNGVKYYGDRDADEIIAYATALINLGGGALKPLFNHLLDTHSGIHYEVAGFRTYEDGGLGGEVNAEPVLVGTLPFLRSMGVEVPEGIRVSHAIGLSVDGELAGLFAIAYDKVRSANAGIATLCGYSRLRPLLLSQDFMLTEDFIRSKFGVNSKRVVMPEPGQRAALRQKTLEEGSRVYAISTSEGLAPMAFCVTGARALKSACTTGVLIHMIGGALGIAMMLVLGLLGAGQLMTPVNMFLYELVWLVPGLLITEWTRKL